MDGGMAKAEDIALKLSEWEQATLDLLNSLRDVPSWRAEHFLPLPEFKDFGELFPRNIKNIHEIRAEAIRTLGEIVAEEWMNP